MVSCQFFTLLQEPELELKMSHNWREIRRKLSPEQEEATRLYVKAVFPEGEVEIEQFKNVAGSPAESESEDSRQVAA